MYLLCLSARARIYFETVKFKQMLQRQRLHQYSIDVLKAVPQTIIPTTDHRSNINQCVCSFHRPGRATDHSCKVNQSLSVHRPNRRIVFSCNFCTSYLVVKAAKIQHLKHKQYFALMYHCENTVTYRYRK